MRPSTPWTTRTFLSGTSCDLTTSVKVPSRVRRDSGTSGKITGGEKSKGLRIRLCLVLKSSSCHSTNKFSERGVDPILTDSRLYKEITWTMSQTVCTSMSFLPTLTCFLCNPVSKREDRGCGPDWRLDTVLQWVTHRYYERQEDE